MKLVFVNKLYVTESDGGMVLESVIENSKVSKQIKVLIRSCDNKREHKFLRELEGEKVRVTIEKFK